MKFFYFIFMFIFNITYSMDFVITCDTLCAQNLSNIFKNTHKQTLITHNPFLQQNSQTPMAQPISLKLEAIMNTKALIDGIWYKSGHTPFGTIIEIYNDHIRLSQNGKVHTIKISEEILWHK